MAEVLVLTRRDGSTEVAHIGSPFLAVLFEQTFHRSPDGAEDAAWMAYYDKHDRVPVDSAELMGWLKQFIATDRAEYEPPDPTVTATNGPEPEGFLPD
jgi:hypothetical protein